MTDTEEVAIDIRIRDLLSAVDAMEHMARDPVYVDVLKSNAKHIRTACARMVKLVAQL